MLWDIFCDLMTKESQERNGLSKKKLTSLFDDIPKGSMHWIPYPKTSFDLETAFLKLKHIPHGYMKRFVGYSRKIIDLTGWDGYIQAMFGYIIEDPDVPGAISAHGGRKVKK